jgi:hypothetical protein
MENARSIISDLCRLAGGGWTYPQLQSEVVGKGYIEQSSFDLTLSAALQYECPAYRQAYLDQGFKEIIIP